MADAAMTLARAHPLHGRRAFGEGVEIAPGSNAFQTSLRAAPEAVNAVSRALGLKLPTRPKTSAVKGSRAALWLGPDEWLVIDEDADPGADLARVRVAHSVVDVSYRNVDIVVSGPRAEDVLAHGCPQDLGLACFPQGACSRTVFGKSEIVLWRTEPQVFRIVVWRSFSDYVFTFLADAARST